jgi:hypothetical protein
LRGLRDDAESDCFVGIDECEALSISPATEIERFTFNTVYVHGLTWFKTDPYASRRVRVDLCLVPDHCVESTLIAVRQIERYYPTAAD